MTRDEALAVLKQHLKNKNLINHSLALEAVLRALARRLGEDEELWGLTGLLHDIDYEETGGDMDQHTVIGSQILRDLGVDEQIIHATLAHNDKAPRESALDKAVFAADPLTGLIVAAALIKPEKTLSTIDTDFVLNRFKEKGFARGARREDIMTCESLGLDLREFVDIGLRAMQEIASQIGL